MLRFCLALIIALLLAGPSFAADPAAAKAATNMLLQKGWDKTPSAREAPKRQLKGQPCMRTLLVNRPRILPG